MERAQLDSLLETQLDDCAAVAVYADRLLELGDPLGDCIVAALAGRPVDYRPCFPGAVRALDDAYLYIGAVHGIPRELALIGWEGARSTHSTVVSLVTAPAARFVHSLRLAIDELHVYMNGDKLPELIAALAGKRIVAPVTELSLGHTVAGLFTPPALQDELRARFPGVRGGPLQTEHGQVALICVDANGMHQATPQPVYLRPPYSDERSWRVDDASFKFLADAVYVRCGAQQVTLNKQIVDVPPKSVLKLVAGDDIQFAAKTPPGFGQRYRVVGLPPGADEPWSDRWIPKSKKQLRREQQR